MCLVGGLCLPPPLGPTQVLPRSLSQPSSLRAFARAAHRACAHVDPHTGNAYPPETALALSYPWLDVIIWALFLGFFLQLNTVQLPFWVGCYLAGRGVWLEGLGVAAGGGRGGPGRPWWLALVAVWPPAAVGAP